jgi:hypothetical protein
MDGAGEDKLLENCRKKDGHGAECDIAAKEHELALC